MSDVSRFAEQLPRSGIRTMMEAASRVGDVLSLTAGEPSFRTPGHVIEAALQAARDGHTRYAPSVGVASLREVVADRYRRRWRTQVSADQVVIGAGAVNAILTTLRAVTGAGHDVLIPDPGWPNYEPQVLLTGARPVRYPLRLAHGFVPDLADLDAACTPRTNTIVLNNPSNPCGVVWPLDTVRGVMAWAARRDLWVLSDEIYEDLVFDGEMVPAAVFDPARTIAIGGCSKSYAMTGWRIGWAVAPPRIVPLAGTIIEALVSCASEVSQHAAIAALTGPQDVVATMRDAYRRRRDLARERLAPAGLLPVVPGGAFYALADLRSCRLPSQEVAMRLLHEQRLATVPGNAFGEVAEGFVRITFAADDAIVESGCDRLVSFARQHG